MINPNFPSLLLDRELGVTPTGTLIEHKFKNLSPTLLLQFPSIPNILSIHSKQNIILILTKAGHAFIYNSFFPELAERVGEESIRILKLSLLDNNNLILVYKENTKRELKLRYQNYLHTTNFFNSHLLDSILIEDIEHFDADYNNLVLKQSGNFLVIDVFNQIVKFEGIGSNYIYSHDYVAQIHSNSNCHRINLVRLKDNSVQYSIIHDCRPLNVIDLFPEHIIYIQAGKLHSIEFEAGEINSLTETPPKYFIGKYHSAALFPRHFIIMNRPWSKLEISAKLICADLVGILIVYEKLNSRLIVLKDNGDQLRSMNLSINPIHISLNPDTLEVYIASKTSVQVFE